MDQEQLDGIKMARTRYEILKLVRTRHRAQQSRMDHVELWHMLRGIGLDIGENDAITCLQDLEMANMVSFETARARRSNDISIFHIQLLPLGLAILERRAKNDLILS